MRNNSILHLVLALAMVCAQVFTGTAFAEDKPVGMIDQYTFAKGSFDEVDSNAVISGESNSLAVNQVGEYVYGTLEADITLTGKGGDNGIVFALTEGNSTPYWDGNGASYYFFFIDGNGSARLGRTASDEIWRNCAEKLITGFDKTGTYRLTVMRDDVSIECYINGVLYLTYSDYNPLTGTKYGLRTGLPGITLANLTCKSTELPAEELAADFIPLQGKLVKTAGDSIRAKAATVALHNTLTLTDGTLMANMAPAGSGASGIIFGADEKAESYYTFAIEGRNAKLYKTVNGSRKMIQQGVLSAGYTAAGNYTLEVVKNGAEISCYFHLTDKNRICYASFTDESPLEGNRVGVYTSGAGTVYSGFAVSEQKEAHTTSTLLFGHSYMELWNNEYHADFPEYPDIDNIGIGGSIAAHWVNLVDQVASYQPSLGIYMIGINGLTGYISPESIAIDTEKALLAIKEQLPDFRAVLVGVNHCPARQDAQYPGITKNISKTNELFREIAASYDWILYAETEYLFCTEYDATTVQNHYFSDTLHLNAAGYDKLAEAIRSAIRGENQPTVDPDREEGIVQEAKERRLSALAMYNEHAYTAEGWAQAKPIWEAAVSKINACTSKTEVNELDLSAELAGLAAIETKAGGIADRLLASGTTFAAETWEKLGDKALHMSGYSYALDDTARYTDTEIAFRMDNNTGAVGAGGVFLRATRNETNGIDGYLVNYVTDLNYIQIYYIRNLYNTTGTASVLTYLGGWVFPGSVVGTDFYVKVEGSTLYLTTLEEYREYGISKSIIVDLTYGGQYDLYKSGYMGELSWSDFAFDLTVPYITGKVADEAEETAEEIATAEPEVTAEPAEEIVPEDMGIADQLLAAGITFGTESWTKKAADALHMSGFSYILDDSAAYADVEVAFRMDNNTGSIGAGGVFLRATRNDATGIDGYLVNYVTDPNFIQIYYCQNLYNTTGADFVLTYLGGWVFPGNVVGADFYVKTEGFTLYLTTLDEYEKNGISTAIVVDLTLGGQCPLYETGYMGVVCWADAGFDLTLPCFAGTSADVK